jgi:hypothetical protein
MLKNTQRDEKSIAWSLRDEDVDSCSDDSGDEDYIDRFHDSAYFAMSYDNSEDSDISDDAAALVTMMGSFSLDDPKKLSVELLEGANIKRPEPRKTQSIRLFSSVSNPGVIGQNNGLMRLQGPRATIGNESMFKAPKTRSGSFASLSQPASTRHGNGGTAPQRPRVTIGNESMFKAPKTRSGSFASLSQPALTRHSNVTTTLQGPRVKIGNESMVKAPKIKKNKRSNSLKQKNSAAISQRSRLKVGKAFSFDTFKTENRKTNGVRPVKRYLGKSETDDGVTKKIRLG